MSSRLRAALALLLAIASLAAGCTPHGEDLRRELTDGTRNGRYIPLEFVEQEPARCGSAALAEVLAYWKAPRSTEPELASEVFSESLQTTFNADLVLAARQRGLVVRDGPSGLDELREAVADGYPAVVLITLSPHALGRQHYMTIKGVDLDRGYLMADDGRRSDAVLRPRPFRRDWRASRYWVLYCWPPDKSPSWASAPDELTAGVLLEEQNKPEAAREAYLRAREKEPNLWEADFNLGNLAAAAGDLSNAIESYRRARDLAPEEPDPLNNLAWVLTDAGRDLEEAETSARRALELSPAGNMAAARAAHTLARVLAARGKREEARAALERAAADAETAGRADLAEQYRTELEKMNRP